MNRYFFNVIKDNKFKNTEIRVGRNFNEVITDFALQNWNNFAIDKFLYMEKIINE